MPRDESPSASKKETRRRSPSRRPINNINWRYRAASLPLAANLISGQVRPESGDEEAAEAKEPTHRDSGELALDAARVLDRS